MIVIKSKTEMDAMRVSGRLAAEVLSDLCAAVRPGVMTEELDRLARTLIGRQGAKAAFLGYRGFPGAICVSVNDEVIHGIPGSRVIQAGDLVSIDVGVSYKGFIGDTAFTVIAGDVADAATRELVAATRQALADGIAAVRPGGRLGDVSHAVESTVKAAGCSVVRDFVGHGVGRELHEDPQVPNHGAPGKGPLLRPGMTFCIEPMVNRGRREVDTLDDGWTVVTRDGKPSAHFEHTVAVLDDGVEVLTRLD